MGIFRSLINKFALIFIALLLLSGLGYAKDLRAVKISKFLERYPWSPLRGHEQEIVYCADKFGIDYRLYLALAGAESTYGKRYPTSKANLTGYLNGSTRFKSVYQNIYETSRLIGTTHYYEQYRQTKDLWDLIYVYKGVPPYQHYYRNMRYALDQINKVPIAAELRAQKALLAKLPAPTAASKIGKAAYHESMFTWNAVDYDRFTVRQKASVAFASLSP
ncbi:MAG: hypothetical protein PHH60_05885 [Candidatus Margulisbacteria bacterium]|nr:hypothetical protein [Candidatus Margulisiibacteriota bacterium]